MAPPFSSAVDQHTAATAATYDRIAPEYAARSDDDGSSADFLLWRASLLASSSASAGPLLDLGCGPGRDLAAFRGAGLPCMGIDLSEGMLAIAVQRGLHVVRGDLRDPPVQPGSIGTVYCCAALLHVPREQVPATLRAWHALLRRGGRLHLSTSLGEGEGWEAVPYAPDRGPRSAQPLRRWFVHHELEGLVGAVTAAGFAVERAQTRRSHRTWVMLDARA